MVGGHSESPRVEDATGAALAHSRRFAVLFTPIPAMRTGASAASTRLDAKDGQSGVDLASEQGD
jgi:hypothetical protein